MRRSLLFVWTLIGLVCPAAMAAEDFIPPQPLHQAGLVKFWQLRLPLEKDQQVRDAYLVGDQLYLGTQDGYVYAVHALTGAIRWLQPVTRSGYRVRRPCQAGDQIIFVTPTDVQVYDHRTGEGISRHELRFPSGTAPTTDGVRYFIGGIDRRLYASDIQTHLGLWKLLNDGPISSTPAIRGEVIFVANDAGTVSACTRADKIYYWKATTYGAVSADLVADENGVYAASRDQSLYLLDLEHGNVRWRARFSGPLYDAPMVTPELAFQYCPDDGLVAVETAVVGVDRRQRWKLPQGRLALTVDEQHVYVLTTASDVLVVKLKDGKIEHTVPTGGFTLGMPAIESNTIFLASPDGRLFCARPRGVPFLRRADVLAALRPPGAPEPTEEPTTQPATQPAEEVPDRLRTKRGGAPIGGKSKVSREHGPGGSK